MIVTEKIKIDLLRQGIPSVVNAMQSDTNTRVVEASLYSGGVPYIPPEGASASIAFLKPDGKKGWYDTLPNKQAACTVVGNTVVAYLAPEVLTAVGIVVTSIVLLDDNMNQLSTLPFSVLVSFNPAAGENISNNYYNIKNLDDLNAVYNEVFQDIQQLKNQVEVLNSGGLNLKDDFIKDQIIGWLDEHPEATTTVQDGAITEPKIARDLLTKKMKYTYIAGKTVSLKDGYYIYTNCTINAIPTETVLNGEHIFIRCEFDKLFIRGGEYEFRNCSFESVRVVHSTARFYSCTGKNINLTGDCHNSVIDGCKLISTAYAPIIISGGVADNVKISNNTCINNAPTGEFVYETVYQTQCINTHGVTNSVIENNYCRAFIANDTTGVSRGGTAIDISGHSDTPGEVRSFSNVVRNNVIEGEGGGITIYCAKNIVCQGNIVSEKISVSGFTSYQDGMDYGTIQINGNVCYSFYVSIRNNPTIKVFICGNTTNSKDNAIVLEYALPENVEVHYVNNAQHSRIHSRDEIHARVLTPEEWVYIPAGGSMYIPMCYVLKSEISTIQTSTYYNGGIVKNETNIDRYINYRKINILAGVTKLWNQ